MNIFLNRSGAEVATEDSRTRTERWRDLTSLYHKCLAGSAAIHLIILFLMMIWFITKSAEAVKMYPMNVSSPDFYAVYYATLALYQHQGPIWTDWNDRLKEALPLLQKKDGDEAGSWNPTGGHSAAGGRVISTTMATLSLEVYYRLLPMYGFRNTDAPPPKQKGAGPESR